VTAKEKTPERMVSTGADGREAEIAEIAERRRFSKIEG